MQVRDAGAEDVDGMAEVWAAATAARDGHPTPAGLAEARVPIAAAMCEPGAVAVVAVEHAIAAFAIAVGAPPVAEVRFVGVAPGRWRAGLGARVMDALAERLAGRGFRSAGLLVYADNGPAIRLYERCGWVASDAAPTPHPLTGRLERRYRLTLRPRAAR